MIKQAGILVVLLLSLISLGMAQDDEGRWDIGVGMAATFPQQASGKGVVQTATKGAGFLGSVRFKVGGHGALEANFGHGHDTQEFLANTLSYRFPTTVSEFTGAYVYRFTPIGRFHPFALAGGGVMVFNPNDTLINYSFQSVGATRQTQPAFLYGAGMDCHIISVFALRVQYRGLLYNTPSLHVPSLVTGQRSHLAEPAVGIVVRF